MRIKEEYLGIKEKDGFGQRTVLGAAFSLGLSRAGAPIWAFVCECSCGSIDVVRAQDLYHGGATSCRPCGYKRVSEKLSTRKGESKSRIYQCWIDMMKRCYDLEHPQYKDYGGRGITVCEDWHVYENFRDWALGHGYQDDLEIDRFPDNDGIYEPSNCRWATDLEQNNNKRPSKTSIFLEAFGEKKTLRGWSRDPRCIVPWSCFYARISKGMNPELALTTPSSKSLR